MCGGRERPPYHARHTPYNPATGDKRNVSRAACMPPLRIDQTRSRAQNVAIRRTVAACPTFFTSVYHGTNDYGHSFQNGPYLRILHNGRPTRLVQNGRLRQKCRAALDGRGNPGVYWAHGKGAGEFSLRRFLLPGKVFRCASRTTRKGASPALQAGPAPFSVPGQTPQALPGGRKKNRRGRNFVYDRRHFHH